MKFAKIFATVLVSSSVVFAEAVAVESTTQPTTSPTTKSARKFPTPAELARQMMAKKEEEKSKTQVAFINLNREFREKPAEFSLFSEEQPIFLDLIKTLQTAKDDEDLKAVLFYIGTGTGLHLSQAQEVADVLNQIQRSGKRTFIYADTYDTTSYIIASAATDVCLLEGGEIFVPGIGFETMFFKGTFDKIGVQADYVQIGEYKGAEEPFTRTEPSTELTGEMNKLVDAFYKQIVSSIASNRNLKTDSVKKAIDQAMMTAKQAKTEGWVDHLVDADGLRPLIKEQLGDEINLIHHYGEEEKPEVDFSNPFAIFQMLNNKQRPESSRPQVALVYATGTIVDGHGGSGMLGGESIGSEDIRRAMRMADRDENVKAVVIRIDSPGGSALASEAMWQSVKHVSEKKPVIISIGSMAASGGYYLASAGDHIIADPAGIVGSIGVVGGKFVLTDLYSKLGLSTKDFSRGENANLFSSNSKFDDRQKKMIQTWMKNTYEQFTDRVTKSRGSKVKNVDEIARGRIFLADDAIELGMVDQLGGLDTAITHAAEKVKLGKDDYDVTIFPPAPTFAEIISGRYREEADMPISKPKMQMQVNADSFLHLLPRDLRHTLGQQLQLMQILENRPVALMSPFVLTTK